MTAAMHDDRPTAHRNPALLRPGTLIHLWSPNEPKAADNCITARVERSTVDTILAIDQRDGARGKYDVGDGITARTPPGLRWQWEIAQDPDCPDATPRFIQRTDLDLNERRTFLFGPPGQVVTVFTTCGTPVAGVVSTVLMDGPDPIWIEVTPPPDTPDPRGVIVHRIQWRHIVTIQQVTRS